MLEEAVKHLFLAGPLVLKWKRYHGIQNLWNTSSLTKFGRQCLARRLTSTYSSTLKHAKPPKQLERGCFGTMRSSPRWHLSFKPRKWTISPTSSRMKNLDSLSWQPVSTRTISWQQKPAICEKHSLVRFQKALPRRALNVVSHAEPANVLAASAVEKRSKNSSNLGSAVSIGDTDSGKKFHHICPVKHPSLSECDSEHSRPKHFQYPHKRHLLLKDIFLLDDRHKETLDIYTQRLEITSSRYDDQVRWNVAEYGKYLQVRMKTSIFDPFDPISTIVFVSFFKLACDNKGIHEGSFMWLLHFFIKR